MKDKNIIWEVTNFNKVFARAMNLKIDKEKCPTGSQMQIIECLMKENGSMYQRDLEHILNLRRATVSGVLHTMEKNGLLKRITSDKDSRSKMIIIDDKVSSIYSNMKKRCLDIEKVVRKDISEEDLETFSKVLNKMEENLRNMESD